MRVCILGGGTAGWMTASALSKKLKNTLNSITLVESEAIGTVGVGEATLPHIKFFNDGLGIEENDFMRKTEATYKLGIEFCDWGRVGQKYIHPFGDFGLPIDNIDFYHYWLKLKQKHEDLDLDDYAYGIVAARNNKFQQPSQGNTKLQQSFGYAYQFDSSSYAAYLRNYAETNGVDRIEGKATECITDPKTGNIDAIQLDNDQLVQADLFVDCSGFRGVLIEQTLSAGYQDWSKWLPCNKAIAVPSESAEIISPFTRATARSAGWQWRIPLQHRTGNGYVFCDEFISDDEAMNELLTNLETPALADPKMLFFKTGRRNIFWKKNVVAIGLSGGFLEPLESTSIHLIQEGITNLLELFPDSVELMSEDSLQLDKQEYNTRMALQYERIRDFLLLHYVANERTDSEMWRYFQSMELPESLQQKINIWLARGYIPRYEFGTFLPPSWIAVLIGQNLIPKRYDRRIDSFNMSLIEQTATQMKTEISDSVSGAPGHIDYISSIGAASSTGPLTAK